MGLADIYRGTSESDRSILSSLGVSPVSEGGAIFCGVSHEEFAINGVTYQWPRGSHLTWGIEFSRLGSLLDMDCKDAITAALGEISACCDVTHEYVANVRAANLKLTSQRLDGPMGVLADFQIPVGNVSVNTTQLLGRFDDGETWALGDSVPNGQIDFYRVVLHELEHAHGLGHKPASIPGDALIAPIYSPRIRHLQPLDIQELVRRYGESKQKPASPPPVNPGPLPTSVKATVSLDIDGVKWEAAGPLKRVS